MHVFDLELHKCSSTASSRAICHPQENANTYFALGLYGTLTIGNLGMSFIARAYIIQAPTHGRISTWIRKEKRADVGYVDLENIGNADDNSLPRMTKSEDKKTKNVI